MKPKKFNRLSAAIPVIDLQETLDYYKEKFGFYDEWADGPDGGLHRDDLRVLFAEDPAYAKLINTDQRRFVILWFVDNVDEIYREFKVERKIEIVQDIESKHYGIREFSIIDNNGYLIRIAEGIEE
ncbi:MAG TPA: VOC family protein [Mucilaginibacter sp.]|nr:VOC family protein [Mucilaginibacter sp.]